jgi:hypothetical protein
VDNAGIADRLDAFAGVLELGDANPYTIRAYRRAAQTVRRRRNRPRRCDGQVLSKRPAVSTQPLLGPSGATLSLIARSRVVGLIARVDF